MKTLILWSSANTDGLTAAAKDAFVRGLQQKGIETEEIWLNGRNINCCKTCGADGWGTCVSDGTCTQDDDFAEIYRKMTEADGIVLATAVYFHDVTECMKLLLDRLRRCEAMHNHFFKGKTASLIACAGGSGNGAIECLNLMEITTQHMAMKLRDRLPVTRYNRDYMLPALEQSGARYGTFLLTGE